jgi:dihydrofolate reductase
MKAILAMSENRAIGKNGGLPWPSIKEDFKWFKEFTMNKTLIVGRTTFNTLPKLKDRECYVVTRNSPMSTVGFCTVTTNSNGYVGKEIHITTLFNTISYEQLYELFNYLDGMIKLNESESNNWIVAGGAKTYELFLPYITEFYVTHVKGTYDADTFMPPFEHLYNKQEVVKEFDSHKVIKYSK